MKHYLIVGQARQYIINVIGCGKIKRGVMQVRKARVEEAEALWALRNDALRTGCQGVYDAETLAAWTPDNMPSGFLPMIQIHPFFVVDDEWGTFPVGSGFLDLTNHRVEAVFTLSSYQRKGVASLIMNAIKHEAIARGIRTLKLSSTPNAVAFYQHHDFTLLRQSRYFSPLAQKHLDCFLMQWCVAESDIE
ncbi:GNAT family N-acetyltransferase [Yersinia ruckeri]|uniref:GNAT family N-acetyltransferase n=1 Tax=Yersinia ruckeri TaxID=29486 RepID=UPI0028F45C0B|nr:GNAT family N-acetyltransferase [Yersinia ruckeri]